VLSDPRRFLQIQDLLAQKELGAETRANNFALHAIEEL
jgi:hypothetical protein